MCRSFKYLRPKCAVFSVARLVNNTFSYWFSPLRLFSKDIFEWIQTNGGDGDVKRNVFASSETWQGCGEGQDQNTERQQRFDGSPPSCLPQITHHHRPSIVTARLQQLIIVLNTNDILIIFYIYPLTNQKARNEHTSSGKLHCWHRAQNILKTVIL